MHKKNGRLFYTIRVHTKSTKVQRTQRGIIVRRLCVGFTQR